MLGLCCCAWAFSSCGEQGLLFMVVHGLLIAVASLVSWVLGLSSLDSAHGLSFPEAYGILLEQGLNPDPLQWQADS